MEKENNIEMTDEFAQSNAPAQEVQFEEQDKTGASPVMLRRKIKGGFNWAGSIYLFTMAIVLVVSIICSTIYSSKLMTQVMAEQPDIQYEELITEVTERAASDSTYMVIVNAVCMVIADAAAFVIVYFAAKRFKLNELFTRPTVKGSSIILAMLAMLGMQGISIFVQSIVSTLTGYTGLSEEVAGSLSFSDNTTANIILVLYGVILGPILEELLYRGLALNLFAPANRGFAIIASSLLFGLMHSNFNQIFNAFLLGLILGYIAMKSGSVIPSIICHIFANANAFLISYIFEYKLANAVSSESAAAYEMITFAIEAVIGIIALVFLLKKNGKINSSDMITPSYTYVVDEANEKKLKWKAFFTSPTILIMAAYCIFTAINYVTKI